MDDNKYKLEDFLSDARFRDWVLNPTQESQLYWEKWMRTHPDHRELILSAREAILSFQFQKAEVVSPEEKEVLLKNILGEDKMVNSRRRGSNYRLFYKIAASILIVLCLSLYYLHFTKTKKVAVPELITQVVKENPRGQKTRFTLPDGSKVWLNSDSRIEYPDKFVARRTIYLQGEAFFEVAENPEKPFEVVSRGIITTAIGTSFNVSAFEGHDIEVGLVTGRISVETETQDQNNRVYAGPGEMVIYNQALNGLQVKYYTNLDFIKWTDRIIVFKRAGFPEIKEKLERWYDVRINARNLDREMTFTGEFKNESLERILERMAFVEKFSFEINDKEVNIFFE